MLSSRLSIQKADEAMNPIPSNDTRAARFEEPDAHGQAALLLVESLLHALVEKGALSAVEAMAALRTACEVKVEVAEMIGESNARMQASLDLLARIEGSFATYRD